LEPARVPLRKVVCALRKKKILSYLKEHPSVFRGENGEELPHIPAESIPEPPEWLSASPPPRAEKRAKPWFLRPAFAAPALCVVAAACFFLSSPGKAIAKSVYSTVINWFSDESGITVEMKHGTDADLMEEAPQPEMNTYKSLSEVPGCFKKMFAENPGVSPSSVTVTSFPDDEGSYLIDEVFQVPGGEIVVSIDYCECESSRSGVYTTETGRLVSAHTANGLDVAGIHEKGEDGRFSGVAAGFYEHSEFSFCSTNVDYEAFVAFIEQTTIHRAS